MPVSRRVISFITLGTGACIGLVGALGVAFMLHWGPIAGAQAPTPDDIINGNSSRMIDEGRRTFRFDTFGSEHFFGDAIQLHKAIEGSKMGGVGDGVSPKTALAVGLKVDATAIPASVAAAIKAGQVNLDDPAVTLTLLKLNAVVGVTGFFNSDGSLSSVGIQCALCHSTVDNSFAPGIGRRLDGWPNRDLNVGAIIALSPDLSVVNNLLGVDDATTRKVLAAWGPGKFDAELFLDGKGLRPDGKTAAVLIPPAYGLAGVNLHTYTGWGSVTYWNAFVANLEMHGNGVFYDPRLDDANKFPIAAKNRFGHLDNPRLDLITAKLPALQFYQLSIPAPSPGPGTFDPAAADRGKAVFNGAGQCATCHVPPIFTEPGWDMHTADQVGIDNFQASRSPDGMYRTTPLKGLFSRQTGGFYHDGRFTTLMDVVNHYTNDVKNSDGTPKITLTDQQKSDLVQYLLSI